MTSGDGLHNKQQRKKVRRKERQQRERRAHRNLDAVTTDAIQAARSIVSSVAENGSAAVIDVPLASLSEAQFVRKRVNDALHIDEWLDEVSVVLWQANEHRLPALSQAGRSRGFELRIERAID